MNSTETSEANVAFDGGIDSSETSSEEILSIFEADISPASKSERTRLRVIASAAKVFADKGFHETSIQDIADDAGVAKGTIYYYVEKKEDLLLLLLELGQGILFSKIEKGIGDYENAVDRIEFVLTTHLAVVRTVIPILPIFVQDLLSADSRIADSMKIFRERYLGILRGLIKEGKESGELKEVNEEEVAYSVLSLVLGQLMQQKAFMKQIDTKQIIKITIDVAIRSILNDASR